MLMPGDDLTLQKFGRNFSKGAILFKDGELNKEMYVIHNGKVRITKRIGDSEKTLAVLGSGEFLGEMATLLDKPRSATAEVVEDSLLIVIEPHTFANMITANTNIALKIIKKLAARLLEANEKNRKPYAERQYEQDSPYTHAHGRNRRHKTWKCCKGRYNANGACARGWH